mgnify:CR=1 FL=1
MNEETRTQQEIYELNMTEEQLHEFRISAIRETTIYETRPYLQKLEENYMKILEEAYYERTTFPTGIKEK